MPTPAPHPLLSDDGTLRPVIKVLTDYPRDDLASDEVHQAMITALVVQGVQAVNVDVGAIVGLDTVSAGFKTGQLALNSQMGLGHVIYTNCAPRKHIISSRSKGEKMVIGITAGGVVLLTVNSGFTLSPLKPLAEAGQVALFESLIPDEGSQFRSRDFFPDATAATARHLIQRVAHLGADATLRLLDRGQGATLLEGFALLGEPLDLSHIADFPQGHVWYVDNFGNIKLNLDYAWLVARYGQGRELVVAVKDRIARPQLTGAGFSQGEGVLALTQGSSGWPDAQGRGVRFTELFLRGGQAAAALGGVVPGDAVVGLALDDLNRASDQLRAADPAIMHRLNLMNVSEPQLIEVLEVAGLIHNGFDTTRLQEVLSEPGGLVAHLQAFEAFRLGRRG